MKTKFIYAILAISLLVAVSCSRDEKSLFDKNPTERANEAMDSATTILPAAVNGWDMVYFANPTSEGYHVLVRFDADGRAVVAAKNGKTTRNLFQKDTTSAWSVQLDYGPILTFNTYNQVMHAWADPREDGNGYLGDYEFLILSAKSDLVRLKGKKHAAYCYMRPLDANVDWETFFAEQEASSFECLGNANLLVLNKNGKTYMLYPAEAGDEDAYRQAKANNGLFSLAEAGTYFEGLESSIYPYVLTKSGIQMQFGFLGDTKTTLYEHVNDMFVAEDGSTISAGNFNEYFGYYVQFNGMGWTMQMDEVCPVIADAKAQLDAYMKSVNPKATVLGLRVSYAKSMSIYDADSTYISVQYTANGKVNNSVAYKYHMSYDKEGITLTYDAPKYTKAHTGEQLLEKFTGLETILKSIDGKFVLETANTLNPTNGSRIVSTTNPDLYFDIKGTKQ